MKALILLPALTLIPAAAQAAPLDPPGKVYAFVQVTSDYRFDGVSSSDREPAAQLSVHWEAPTNRYFVGTFISQVDYNDPSNTSYEIDTYAGARFPLKGGAYATAQVMYTAFPDKDFFGPTYDFVQLKAKVDKTIGRTALTGEVAWTPETSYGGGPAYLVDGVASVKLKPWLSVSAKAGHRWNHRSPDLNFWNVGATASWKKLAFDVRYHDTDLSRRDCSFLGRACSSNVAATLTLKLD